MGPHTRHYVLGRVADWESVRKRVRQGTVRLLTNEYAVRQLAIYPWDRVHFGEGWHKWPTSERAAISAEIKRAAERGRKVDEIDGKDYQH